MRVRLQRRRPMLPRRLQQHERHGQVDQRGDHRHRKAETHLLDRPRMYQALHRRDRDADGRDQDQRSFDSRREVLRLAMPVRVVLVGRTAATLSIASAISAPARFTSDSSASDSRPTDPVSHHANVLSAIVPGPQRWKARRTG